MLLTELKTVALNGFSRQLQTQAASGKEEGRLYYLAVNDLVGQVELVNHAQRDGTPARLAVVQLALDQVRLDAHLHNHDVV